MRATHPRREDQEFRGLYISEDDVDLMLASPAWPSSLATTSHLAEPDVAALDRLIAELNRRISKIEDGARADNDGLPLLCLRQLFDLSELDVDVLVISLAAEIDLKYERLFAYLQDDVTKNGRPLTSYAAFVPGDRPPAGRTATV